MDDRWERLNRAQIGSKDIASYFMSQRRPGLLYRESFQMLGGRAVTPDGCQRGLENVFMVIEKLLAEMGHGDRRECH